MSHCKLALTSILTVTCFLPTWASTDKPTNSDNGGSEVTTIDEQALLKKQLFYMRLRLVGDLKKADKEIDRLKARRLEVAKAVDRIEFLLNVHKDENGGILLSTDERLHDKASND